MQPINYLPAGGGPDVFANSVNAFELGRKIREDMLQKAMAEEQARRQAEAEQYIGGVMANPNATLEDYAQVLTLNPKLRESVELVTKRRSEEQNQAALRDMGQVYSALTMGRPDVARQLLQRRAEALGNTPGAAQQRTMAQAMIEQLDADPVQVRNGLGVMLAAAPGGKDVVEALGKLGTERRAEQAFPAEQREREAKATTAEVTAKYAEPMALRELEQRGWNIEALKADIQYKREANRIAAMQASLAGEMNDLRRQELTLKIREATSGIEGRARERAAEAETAATTMDNMLNTIRRVRRNPSLPRVLGTIEGRLPAIVSDEAADAIALIDNLGSQAFLAQIPAIKGMGQLSNAEGDKLQAALQNLTRVQSEKQFRESLAEAERLVLKARSSVTKRLGVPLPAVDAPGVGGGLPVSPPKSDLFNRADAIIGGR